MAGLKKRIIRYVKEIIIVALLSALGVSAALNGNGECVLEVPAE
jgi:hypothetical protein